jgi:hypothetical protein
MANEPRWEGGKHAGHIRDDGTAFYLKRQIDGQQHHKSFLVVHYGTREAARRAANEERERWSISNGLTKKRYYVENDALHGIPVMVVDLGDGVSMRCTLGHRAAVEIAVWSKRVGTWAVAGCWARRR